MSNKTLKLEPNKLFENFINFTIIRFRQNKMYGFVKLIVVFYLGYNDYTLQKYFAIVMLLLYMFLKNFPS
jgi:hypothetical protein